MKKLLVSILWYAFLIVWGIWLFSALVGYHRRKVRSEIPAPPKIVDLLNQAKAEGNLIQPPTLSLICGTKTYVIPMKEEIADQKEAEAIKQSAIFYELGQEGNYENYCVSSPESLSRFLVTKEDGKK